LLPALTMGADGAVGSTYNFPFAVPIYTELIKAFEEGNLSKAADCQERANQLIRIIQQYPWTAAVKVNC
jgi:N-acetylneuraminate lyase